MLKSVWTLHTNVRVWSYPAHRATYAQRLGLRLRPVFYLSPVCCKQNKTVAHTVSGFFLTLATCSFPPKNSLYFCDFTCQRKEKLYTHTVHTTAVHECTLYYCIFKANSSCDMPAMLHSSSSIDCTAKTEALTNYYLLVSKHYSLSIRWTCSLWNLFYYLDH